MKRQLKYLRQDLSQSRIDKHSGSSACSVIAALTAHRVLAGILSLPDAPEACLSVESVQTFLDCIRQGNYIYDTMEGMSDLLSVNQAVTALSSIPVKIQQEYFFNQQKGWKQLVVNLFEVAQKSSDGLAAGVLITTPFSVMIASTSTGSVYIFDSHSHGPFRGALVAVSSSTATTGSKAVYLSQFFSKQFGLVPTMRLGNSQIVDRQFHFAFHV